jgi:SAM-dependent methyltransferase
VNYLEILEKLGVSGAHPGGFKATKKWVESLGLSLGSKILEVGCGTGESACYLATRGYRVSALDNSPRMLQIAERRAQEEGVTIDWVSGSAESIPFPSNFFDVVFAESVTIFTDAPRALHEYFRVLKPSGMLIDNEMTIIDDLPLAEVGKITDFMNLDRLYKVGDFSILLQNAGFQVKQPIETRKIGDLIANVEEQKVEDASLYFDYEISKGIETYMKLMVDNLDCLGSSLFIAEKKQ